MVEKVKSYVGFAIKARKVLFGVDNITEYRKRLHLIMLDNSLSPNSTKKILRYAEEREISIIIYDINSILPERNCKAMGIMDQNLAVAILKELKES